MSKIFPNSLLFIIVFIAIASVALFQIRSSNNLEIRMISDLPVDGEVHWDRFYISGFRKDKTILGECEFRTGELKAIIFEAPSPNSLLNLGKNLQLQRLVEIAQEHSDWEFIQFKKKDGFYRYALVEGLAHESTSKAYLIAVEY